MNIHEQYMERAIYLAKKGLGKVSPNPMVGCIIVKNGEIIGEGYHAFFGGPHAEVEAFKNCIKSPTDASVYISLEPCSHQGKTPPCCNLMIENGVRDIYIAMKDPNPIVNGNGIKYLINSGINVDCTVLSEQAKLLNKGYIKWITTKKPFVIGKMAQNKNGFIAKKGKKVWITGEESKLSSHQLRSKVDAIMVGRNTALIDNPQLTVREILGRNPKRIVVDTNRTLPYSLNLFNDRKSETIVLCSNKKFQDNKTSHCQYLAIEESKNKLEPKAILIRLGELGITSLIIEGGASIMNSFLSANLIDQFYLYSSISNNDDLDIKNPFTLSEGWNIIDKKILEQDELIILEKKEECLQES